MARRKRPSKAIRDRRKRRAAREAGSTSPITTPEVRTPEPTHARPPADEAAPAEASPAGGAAPRPSPILELLNGDEQPRRRDDRLIAWALKRRFPMPDEHREAILKRLTRLALDPQTSKKDMVAITARLWEAERMNQRDDHVKEKLTTFAETHSHEISVADRKTAALAAIAAELAKRR